MSYRYTSYHQDKYDRNKERYGQSSQYNDNEEYGRRQQQYDEYKR